MEGRNVNKREAKKKINAVEALDREYVEGKHSTKNYLAKRSKLLHG